MMKGKMLVAGVTTLALAALFGCQQQPAAPTTSTTTTPQPETKTSTMSLEILPPTQQNSTANLEITAPTQEGTMKTEAETKMGTTTTTSADTNK